MPDTLARIAALEQAVSRLSRRSEALQPSYLTVTPNGLVGADFTGVINAQGVILPAARRSIATGANLIEWQRTSDGAVLADIGSGSASLPGPVSSLSITAEGPDNGTTASLTVNGNATGGSGNNDVIAAAGGHGVTLIDDIARSGFLQLAALGQTALAIGTGTLTGTNNFGFTVTINHGLGRVPTVMGLAGNGWNSNAYVSGTPTTTQFQMTVAFLSVNTGAFANVTNFQFANGTNYGYFWWAIG